MLWLGFIMLQEVDDGVSPPLRAATVGLDKIRQAYPGIMLPSVIANKDGVIDMLQHGEVVGAVTEGQGGDLATLLPIELREDLHGLPLIIIPRYMQ